MCAYARSEEMWAMLITMDGFNAKMKWFELFVMLVGNNLSQLHQTFLGKKN